MSKGPLEQATGYVSHYDPQLLFAIARNEARQTLGITDNLPFSGVDLWNAWDLTWLDTQGKPVVATAEIRIPADSPNLIESKSLKLYLNSLAMTRYRDAGEVVAVVGGDLSTTCGAQVQVELLSAGTWSEQQLAVLPGSCIDNNSLDIVTGKVDPGSLTCGQAVVELKAMHSHLLRSLCPVTDQPDSGSILIRYSGRIIDEAGMLQYLVSYRQHNDFHEACVERIFVDIMRQCAPHELTVYARYNRRGGLDINPFRSNFESQVCNPRLWRQ